MQSSSTSLTIGCALFFLLTTACRSEPEQPARLLVETPAAEPGSDDHSVIPERVVADFNELFELPAEESVKPGINDNFKDPELAVEEWVERFEGESREIFVARERIAAAIGLEPGQRIADVGAGTGPFIGLFASAVGSEGKVYALDIAPKFVTHLAERAKAEGYPQIEARLCGETSVDLPPNSIDVAFICDVYHHFEYPRHSMASIHSALGAGGEVVIVDFERIPGVTREWLLDHVRAGKAEVFAELDEFGFDLVEELDIDGLEENWVARFRKR